jgi:hypothetical protein
MTSALVDAHYLFEDMTGYDILTLKNYRPFGGNSNKQLEVGVYSNLLYLFCHGSSIH